MQRAKIIILETRTNTGLIKTLFMILILSELEPEVVQFVS